MMRKKKFVSIFILGLLICTVFFQSAFADSTLISQTAIGTYWTVEDEIHECFAQSFQTVANQIDITKIKLVLTSSHSSGYCRAGISSTLTKDHNQWLSSESKSLSNLNGWTTFDNVDCTVNELSTYYLIFKVTTTNKDAELGVSPRPDPYQNGIIHHWEITWGYFMNLPEYDFAFEVWGNVNVAPNKPNTPSGPSQGYRNQNLDFTTSTTDPNGDQVKYGWDWNGDMSVDEWTGYYNSGQQITVSHSYSSIGSKTIYVKAEDTEGLQSSWSDPKTVNIVNQVPSTPSVTGPSSGETGDTLTYCATSTDPDLDDIRYGFNWDDGNPTEWTGFYNSGTTICEDHSWGTPGTYNIQVIAEDTLGGQSNPKTITVTILGPNDPPNTPTQPSGPTEGEIGESMMYTTVATDPNGNKIKYGWDWNGDYTVDEWTDYYSSGTEVSTPHSWGTHGTYYVKVKAEDIRGAQSDFSDPLAVYIAAPPPEPNLVVSGSLYWSDVSPGEEVVGYFEIYNDGPMGTELDWEIVDYPNWGTWTIEPMYGQNLKPEDGTVSVECRVIAPSEKEKKFEGRIKVVNVEKPDEDYGYVQISLVTPTNRQLFRGFLSQIFLKFYYAFPLFQRLLNL